MKAHINFRSSWIIVLLFLATVAIFAPQCTSAPQGEIRTNPNRPTVADPADISECGWNHSWLGGQERENDFGALLKFAAHCNLEIRWSPDTVISQDTQRGFGDNLFSARYRFTHQNRTVPTTAAS